jgi:hypothetical protein
MELYRCFFLDETASVFGRTEFHATNDGDAGERAALHTRMHAAARGYTLWQSGRLVAERDAGKPASAPRPDGS